MCCERLRSPGAPPARPPRRTGAAEARKPKRDVCGGVRNFAERRFRGRSALNAPDQVCGAIPRSLKDEPAFGRSPRAVPGTILDPSRNHRGGMGIVAGEAR